MSMSASALKPEEALTSLVALWKKHRAPEVRALVQQLEALAPPAPFTGDDRAFGALARKPSVLEVGSLARALYADSARGTVDRLEAIAPWSEDPRVQLALEGMLRDVRFTSNGARPIWEEVFALLVRNADPRLPEVAKELPAAWRFRENQRAWLGKQLTRAVEAAAAFRAKSPLSPLGAADRKLLAELTAKLGSLTPPARPEKSARPGGSADALLAAVYASPREDAPRLVYADLLLEQGDPRGEFITLQFKADKSKPEVKREAELQKLDQQAWLGAIAPVVLKDVTFSRGFASSVTARFKNRGDVERCGNAPEWSTIEHLAWSVYTPNKPEERPFLYFWPPAAKPCSAVIDSDHLRLLLDTRKAPLELEAVDFTGLEDVPTEKDLARTRLFPGLKCVGVEDRHFELMQTGWLSKVPEVRLVGWWSFGHLRNWLAWLSKRGDERFTVTARYSTLVFTRGADGKLSKLSIARWRGWNHIAADCAATLADGWLTELECGSVDDDIKAAFAAKLKKAKRKKK